jgi:hypothetical protein
MIYAIEAGAGILIYAKFHEDWFRHCGLISHFLCFRNKESRLKTVFNHQTQLHIESAVQYNTVTFVT